VTAAMAAKLGAAARCSHAAISAMSIFVIARSAYRLSYSS
jgi:hypothetical protein